MNRRQWLFLLFALAVAAACIRLGIWQLDRLGQRRQQNAEIQAGLSRPPVSLAAVLESETPAAYQRVIAQGHFSPEEELLLSPRARNGQPGVHLITPLILDEGAGAILVDRGWIAAEERNLPERSRFQVNSRVSLTGFLQPGVEDTSLFLRDVGSQGERLEWQVLDIAAIQQQVQEPLADWVLVQTEPLAVPEPQPIPQPDLDFSEGPHLGYAIQWFSFATIALLGGGYWLWRQRQDGGSAG
jgi:surfeit locus 1 family protein